MIDEVELRAVDSPVSVHKVNSMKFDEAGAGPSENLNYVDRVRVV